MLKTQLAKFLFTLLFDILICSIYIIINCIHFYPVKEISTLMKVDLTANVFALLYCVRVRLCYCYFYPIKSLAGREKFPFKMTRLRIKIVDSGLFFLILIQTLAISAKRIFMSADKYANEEEKLYLEIVISINAIYIAFWLFCTNDKSYTKFPKERKIPENQNLGLIRSRIENLHSNQEVEQFLTV